MSFRAIVKNGCRDVNDCKKCDGKALMDDISEYYLNAFENMIRLLAGADSS